MVKGVSFEEDYKRVYPYNSLACRVLGYTSSGNVGNWGIEQYYNSQLNGVNGRAYYYFNEELDQEQSVKNLRMEILLSARLTCRFRRLLSRS